MEPWIFNKIKEDYPAYNFEKNKKRSKKDYGKFYIGYQVDGLSKTKKTILEIKTRKNITNKLSRKERLQALAYMNIFSYEKCLFVKNGSNGKHECQFLDYNDDEFKRDVYDRLERFTKKARSYTYQEFKDLLVKHNLS